MQSLNEVFALSPGPVGNLQGCNDRAIIHGRAGTYQTNSLIQENLIALEDHQSALKAFQQALAIN